MFEFDSLERISAYVAENRLKVSLEAKIPHMVVEVNKLDVFDVGKRINIEPDLVEIPQLEGIDDDGLKN